MQSLTLARVIAHKELFARGFSSNPSKLFRAFLSFLMERQPQISREDASEEGFSILWQRLLFAGCLRAREFMQLQQAFVFYSETFDSTEASAHKHNLLASVESHLEGEADAVHWSTFVAAFQDEHGLFLLQLLLDASNQETLLSLSERPTQRDALISLFLMNETFRMWLPGRLAQLSSWLSTPEQHPEFAILLRWLSQEIDLVELQRAFTSLAEDVVKRCWSRALREDASAHHGSLRMALIGFGSLGAREMIYLSDLDLVFLYDGEETERCIQVAQRVIALLSSKEEEGGRYEVDTRLRPFGTQGPLITSMREWALYYDTGESMRAHLWEEQALLRARAITGDEGLLASFHEQRENILSRPRDARFVAQEIRRMKQKLEQESPRRHVFHYKTSSGGLLDIDFAVQFLLLTHNDKKLLMNRHTEDALDALAMNDLLSREDAKALQAARQKLLRWSILTRTITEKSGDTLPESSDALRSLLRIEKLSLEEMLQTSLEPLRLQVRACFDRIVALSVT
jgi:hypothetical protein